MKKKKLYGKTERFKMSKIQVTEKLDGSNLGMFNLNDELIIAQRSSIFKLSDLKEMDKSIMYKGLRKFLEDNGEEILKSLHPNSGFFGEWIGMGRIKYPNLDKRLYVFCKARIDFEYNIDKKHYNVKEIDYCFIDMNRPQCLGKVPCIGIFELGDFNKDLIFNTYNKHVPNTVEGMVICFNNSISKIVVNKPDSKKEPMIKQKKDTIWIKIIKILKCI